MNFLELQLGGKDPYLGKSIKVIIDKDPDHIVYLDQDLNFQYSIAGAIDQPTGPILNRITHLESLMGFMRNEKQTIRIKNLLGEAFVRVHTEKNFEGAMEALHDAKVQILALNKEVSSLWYFCSALVVTGLFLVLAVLCQMFSLDLNTMFGSNSATILSVGFLGSVGAFSSVCLRHRKIELDANAGVFMHIIEATARITIGTTAALIMILMVKGGLILNLVEQSPSQAIYTYVALGMLCGASERVLPNFITRAENMISDPHSPSSTTVGSPNGSPKS